MVKQNSRVVILPSCATNIETKIGLPGPKQFLKPSGCCFSTLILFPQTFRCCLSGRGEEEYEAFLAFCSISTSAFWLSDSGQV